ncbi:hypothetical protein TNCV_420621 [Trichonephila clavipes]|nr:hypothetical protein TNCV_420621 [Trichonephila clavipes]
MFSISGKLKDNQAYPQHKMRRVETSLGFDSNALLFNSQQSNGPYLTFSRISNTTEPKFGKLTVKALRLNLVEIVKHSNH